MTPPPSPDRWSGPPAGEDDDVRVYRMAPAVAARLVGGVLVLLAVVLFGATAVVAAKGLPPDVLLVPLVLGLVGALGLGWWLRRRAWVLRLDAAGYRVRLVRGSRVRAAGWSEVREVLTTTTAGHPMLVLRLAARPEDTGRSRETVVPVEVLAGDREELVREVRRRLQGRRAGS